GGEVDELIRRVPHRRDHDDDLVARLARLDDALGHTLDAHGIRDGRAAVLLHDEGHGSPGTILVRTLGPDAGSGFLGRNLNSTRRQPCTTRRPSKARPSVTSSAYSRSPPTGRPDARRVTRRFGCTSRRLR